MNVCPAGWTPFHLYKGSTERDRNLNQTRLNAVLKTLLDKIRNSIHATYFRMPVAVAGSRAAAAVGGVGAPLVAVTDPIDLSVITNRLRLNDYYRNRDMMKHDLLRMVSTCPVVSFVLTLLAALLSSFTERDDLLFDDRWPTRSRACRRGRRRRRRARSCASSSWSCSPRREVEEAGATAGQEAEGPREEECPKAPLFQ